MAVGIGIGMLVSIGGIALAAQLPPLSNFDKGKMLQSSDLKLMAQAIAELQDKVAALQLGGGGGNVKFGFKVYDQPGTYTFSWPAGVQQVFVEVNGSGAAGGSSKWKMYGGGGGSGAYCSAVISRPPSGATTVVVDGGMAGKSKGTLWPDTLQTGPTSFGAGRVDEIVAYGAGIGQSATGEYQGADGGTPGICRGDGLYVVEYIAGGMGGASAAAVLGADPNQGAISAHFPWGAHAPRGGSGANNNQNAMSPGGGGAPGNVEFDSGSGGAGRVKIQWYAL